MKTLFALCFVLAPRQAHEEHRVGTTGNPVDPKRSKRGTVKV